MPPPSSLRFVCEALRPWLSHTGHARTFQTSHLVGRIMPEHSKLVISSANPARNLTTVFRRRCFSRSPPPNQCWVCEGLLETHSCFVPAGDQPLWPILNFRCSGPCNFALPSPLPLLPMLKQWFLFWPASRTTNPTLDLGEGGSEDTHLKLSIGHGCPDAHF